MAWSILGTSCPLSIQVAGAWGERGVRRGEARGPIKQGPGLQDLAARSERLDCIGEQWGATKGPSRRVTRSDLHVREQGMGGGLVTRVQAERVGLPGRVERCLGGAVGLLAIECLQGRAWAAGRLDCPIPGQDDQVGAGVLPMSETLS